MSTSLNRELVGEPNRLKSDRLDGVDLLRGAVMIIMVLDHVRDYFGKQGNPVDLATTTIALFWTRWITHFCAPTFLFLAGTGAYLYGMRGKTKAQMSEFLLTRGLWLVFLELTVIRLGMTFDTRFAFFPLLVIWAIGMSMIVLSALVWLPTWAVAVFGIVMIGGHNAFDGVRAQSWGRFADLWRILHDGGFPNGMLKFQLPSWGLPPGNGRAVFVLYPLIPWIGVMAAGYAFGTLFRLSPQTRRKLFLTIGPLMIVGFFALRWSNLYGDPQPWSVQPRGPVFTVLSFVNCQKYPPSLLFLLMTLGPAITALAFFDRPGTGLAKPIITLGRVPLFYYLLQWPLIHVLAIAVNRALHQPYEWLLNNGPFSSPPGYGYNLPFVYLMWIVTVLILYPPCAGFAAIKRKYKYWWLSYL